VTAIKNGKSFDTSMGFTPLAGLTMATRSGDVDPSLIYYIQEREGLSNEEMLKVLNTKSGLLGVSTISSDMRDLEDVQETNIHAKLALDMFYDRVIRYAGQYFAELGRVDAIIFTAGIGENDPVTRAKVLNALKFAGVVLDETANNVRGKESVITKPESTVTGLLIPTNEELMIARDVEHLKNDQ
ncbi:MAG: acetate kinase, partial [Leuconostoc falkenbergense]